MFGYLVKQISRSKSLNKEDSVPIEDQEIIRKFVDNPDFPFLISFPRTGSHWLRILMEHYFEKPSLVRAFYFKSSESFTCYHTHDIDLNIYRKNVIYLYREATSTIYSQLNYYEENINNLSRIDYWSILYGKHLSKWLLEETMSSKKTVIYYDSLKSNLELEFKKITDHLQCLYDPTKLTHISSKITKKEVSKKTRHDVKVINLQDEYENRREDFYQNYSSRIYNLIYEINPKLVFCIKRYE
jgi:hypothetical protein